MIPRVALLLLVWRALALAQPVVAPSPAPDEEVERTGGYTISNSFEGGYRFATVGGDHDAYRASVNYGNGFRLFRGELRIDSLDGRGRFFDEFRFQTFGAGDDPYQSHTVQLRKNGLYRYDFQYSITDYWNRLPALWSGEHGLRTQRFLQSHDLTLFPESRFEIWLGYDRNALEGLAFGSQGIPLEVGALERDNFIRLLADRRQVNNRYRAGVNFRALGLAVTALQSFDNYKEDPLFSDGSLYPSLAPNVQPISSLRRDEPIHGNTPVTSIALRTAEERWLNISGRFVYASGERNSTLSESLTAPQPSGPPTTRQTFVVGEARRTQGTGDLTLTLLLSPKWTITTLGAVSNMRISGGADFFETSVLAQDLLRFEQLGVRHLSHATEANYRPVEPLSFYGAYRFSTRRVSASEATFFPTFDEGLPLQQVNNDVHAGAAGVRWVPLPRLRASADFEIGRADQPLTPISRRRFHNERFRLQWRQGGFRLQAQFANEANANPVALVDLDSRSRQAGGQISWTDSDGRLTLDGGYSYRSLDSSVGLFNLFDFESAEPAPLRSVYLSRLHSVHALARLAFQKRWSLDLGYTLAKDTGGGFNSPSYALGVQPNYPDYSFDGTIYLNVFPLTWQSPQARLGITWTENLRLNFGWQYYGYAERFTARQNYRAHIGYTSWTWSF